MRWVVPVMVLVACDAGDPCENGSMVLSDQGLVVTEAEHGEGWGRDECEACHALPATHLWVCTEGIDAEALRAEAELRGFDGCADCHGDNGVTP